MYKHTQAFKNSKMSAEADAVCRACVVLLAKETETELRGFKDCLELWFLKMALVVSDFQIFDWATLAEADLREIEKYEVPPTAIESAASYACRLPDKRLHAQVSWSVTFVKVASSLAGVLLLRNHVFNATVAKNAAINKDNATRCCNR